MAVTNTAIFPQAPKRGMVQAVNADGTGKKAVVTAGANGAKVVSLTAASDDTSNRSFGIYVTRSATDYLLGTVTVPLAAGTDGSTPSVDLLGGGTANLIPGLPVDNDGQRYIFLENGDVLKVAALVAVTAAKTVHFQANYADF
jgi:hypothetical protein